MRYCKLLLLIAIAIPLQATTKLYDALKSFPPLKPAYNSSAIIDQPLAPVDEQFHSAWDQHSKTSLLKPQYRLLDPDLDKDYVVEDINVNQSMSGEARALTEDLLYTQFALIAGIGVIAALPQSVSNWDLEQLQEKPLDERWKEHVAAGPIWDQDDFVINYIGHPVSGAVYYVMARNDGMDIFESALFSTVMSSLFWEYGYEAFAEIPSIQDLIVTPLIGSFMGEGMHILEGKLDANNGVIWGSKGLGSFSYFLLDPMGNIAGGLSSWLGIYITMEFATFQRYQDESQFRYSNDQAYPERFQDRDYGFMLTFY